jgi:hypothetical protein
MKDAYEVLQQKEADLARVRKETESLRLVAPLLCEDVASDSTKEPTLSEKPHDPNCDMAGTDFLLSSSPATRRSFHRFRSATDFLESPYRQSSII